VTLYKALGGGWTEHSGQNANVVAGNHPVPGDNSTPGP
jgi:hypothetical protein